MPDKVNHGWEGTIASILLIQYIMSDAGVTACILLGKHIMRKGGCDCTYTAQTVDSEGGWVGLHVYCSYSRF